MNTEFDTAFVIQGCVLIAVGLINIIGILTGFLKIINPRTAHLFDNKLFRIWGYFISTCFLIIGIGILLVQLYPGIIPFI